MYSVKDSNFNEFREVCKISLEPGEPENCEWFKFHKLVYNDEIICVIGVDSDDEKVYLVGAFTDLMKAHMRMLIWLGRAFLSSIGVLPIEVIVEENNKKFERFAEFFGFKKTLAQLAINDIIYSTYVKESE